MKKERKEYEQKYLSRIQKKKVSSSLYKPEKPKPKLDMKKERKPRNTSRSIFHGIQGAKATEKDKF